MTRPATPARAARSLPISAWRGRERRIREIAITGDFFVTPPRTVFDLEASLRNVSVRELRAAVERFFKEAKVGLLTVGPADFATAIEAAAAAPG